MKIQGPPLSSSVRANASDGAGAPSQAASSKRPATEQAPVAQVPFVQAAVLTISAQGRDLAAVAAAPAVRAEKVSALRDEISKGSYRVEPETIAERLVEELLLVA